MKPLLRSILLVGCILGCQRNIIAQPKGVHLSWNGSGSTNTSGTMALTWMNDKQGKQEVLYGGDSLRLTQKQKAKPRYSAALGTYVSKVRLQKLEPATQYYYKVGSNETGWSPVYRFRTGPVAGSGQKMVVGVWSDTQNTTGNLAFERTDTFVKQISRQAYDFTLHNGDLVEKGSVAKSWHDLFVVAAPVTANAPFLPVTGNHDVENDTASPRFQQPFPVFHELLNLPQNGLNYSFDYGNAHFIAINSGWAEGAAKVGKVLFAKGSAEYNWLEADLKKARSNTKTNWIILYSHYPVYSYGFSHIPTWQQHLKPLVDQYKVDLYLAGHRHAYERHKAVRGSEIFEPEEMHLYQNPKGTVYVTNGSCGGNLTGTGGFTLPTMVFTPNEKIFTYAVMTIEGGQLLYEAFNMKGEKIDHFTIRKGKE